jgi:hypothetical protein
MASLLDLMMPVIHEYPELDPDKYPAKPSTPSARSQER